MDFIGVDLAWTPRGRTGLCHVADGRVVDSASLSSDMEILKWLLPRTRGDVLVAIDAPLIVRNQTGRRPCEQLTSQCFGAQDAAAHSSNLRLPSFKNGVRGQWLAGALNLSPDPFFEPGETIRRAVEVYPHTAIVALFNLPKTLKYKARRGRTLSSRSQALSQLLVHIDSLISLNPRLDVRGARWEALVEAAARPQRPADLAVIEDEIDAFVCAYIALYYWTHGTKRCRVIGDLSTGYILTPVTPDQGRCIDSRTLPTLVNDSGSDAVTPCSECGRTPRDTADADLWRFYSDGLGNLVPFCPDCSTREFGGTGRVTPAR